MPPVKELEIQREKWGCTTLLSEYGRMCCLGFLSKACGMPDQRLINVGYPYEGWGVNDGFVLLNEQETPANAPVYLASRINDHVTTSWDVKEELLTDLFAENGIALRFVGDKSARLPQAKSFPGSPPPLSKLDFVGSLGPWKGKND